MVILVTTVIAWLCLAVLAGVCLANANINRNNSLLFYTFILLWVGLLLAAAGVAEFGFELYLKQEALEVEVVQGVLA